MASILDRKIKFRVSQQMKSSALPRVGWSVIRGLLIIGISYIILFPLLTKIATSFMVEEDIMDQTVRWITRSFTLENYIVAFNNMHYPEAFVNTLSLALGVSILQLLACLLTGYGLARFDFPGNKILFAFVIFTLVVPPELITLPLYLHFRFFDLYGLIPEPGLNLLNTFWPLFLLSATGNALRNGLFIFIFRQFFRGMPLALEEASYVDGAGPFRTFFKVMLPGAVPVIVIVFLFAFVWQWNDYYYTNHFMSDLRLLPHTLDNLAENVLMAELGMIDREDVGFTGQYYSIINNTGMLLFIAPLILLYACVQRYFIESIERTGIIG